MDRLDAMRVFVKVVANGSFAQAGRQLGLTRSAVSKGVMELERVLGVRLLDRTTRRVSATEAGLAYFERCQDILARIEETELEVSSLNAEPRGVLKINAPMTFAARYLSSAIADFRNAYPDVRIEASLNDRFIDPIEEGVDVTIRIAQLEDSSLIARKLAPARLVLVAAPNYLEKHGTPETPDDLKDHDCLSYGHSTTLQHWLLSNPEGDMRVPINATMCSNNGDLLRIAALAGHGIAKLPTFIVGPDIGAGRLQTVLDSHRPRDLGIYAMYAPNRYLAAKTRVFVDFMADRFGPEPEWEP